MLVCSSARVCVVALGWCSLVHTHSLTHSHTLTYTHTHTNIYIYHPLASCIGRVPSQGTHDGMCKRHWKQVHFPPPAPKAEDQPPPPEGESVYDKILPASISYRPMSKANKLAKADGETGLLDGLTVMPLITFLRDGAKHDAGWHRNAERRARGHFPVLSSSSQLEPWERQLVRITLLSVYLLIDGTALLYRTSCACDEASNLLVRRYTHTHVLTYIPTDCSITFRYPSIGSRGDSVAVGRNSVCQL